MKPTFRTQLSALRGNSKDPSNPKRWKSSSSSQVFHLFTCGRPGRSKSRTKSVPDAQVHEWVRALPGGTNIALVSLLGRKNDERKKSEFSFYSFYGPWDRAEERLGRPSFQQWLDRSHSERSIQVIEHPTFDCLPITPTTMDAVVCDISRLLSEGRTVILMDSGGVSRTGSVCRQMGFIKDSRTI